MRLGIREMAECLRDFLFFGSGRCRQLYLFVLGSAFALVFVRAVVVGSAGYSRFSRFVKAFQLCFFVMCKPSAPNGR